MNSCRCWSENRHESSWNWLYLIFIDWFTRYVDTGEDYIYIYIFDSIWISFDSDWFQIYLKEKPFLNPYSFVFPLNWENALLTKRPSEPIKKSVFFERLRKYNQNQKSHLNLNFSDGFRKCIPYQKAIWIWIFQMDSELVFLTKRPSESEFFRWIQKLYSWPKGHLNPSESEFFRWIEKMYILVKRSIESIWHWNSFMDTGKRFCLWNRGKKCWRVRQIMFSIEWSLESHIVSNVQIDSEKKHDKFDPSVVYSFEYLNLIVKDQFQNLCPHNV